MTSHDPFRTMLSGVEGPISPDPLFARRLRKQFLAESGTDQETGSDLGLVIDLAQVRRNRLVDCAAVAILLLGILGGLVGIRSGSFGLPTPTVQAADIASPTATSTAIVTVTTTP